MKKCPTSQIWGPCKTSWLPSALQSALANAVGRPHGVLPWAGGQMGWWFASFRALVAKGGPFHVCKCGVPAGLVPKNAQTPPKVNQNGPTGGPWTEMPYWSIVVQKWSKKNTLQLLAATVAPPAGELPISCNLAQNLPPKGGPEGGKVSQDF